MSKVGLLGMFAVGFVASAQFAPCADCEIVGQPSELPPVVVIEADSERIVATPFRFETDNEGTLLIAFPDGGKEPLTQ